MYLPSSPPPSPPPQVRRYRRLRKSSRASSRRQSQRAVTLELTAKLLVNSLLMTAAITSLARLIPSLQDKQAELKQVRSAVTVAEDKHSRLKSDFGRYFDPQQAHSVMQEQSGWESPHQRQVVWTDPIQPSESAD